MAPDRLPQTLLERLCRSEVGETRRLLRDVPKATAAMWAVQLADDVPRRARTDLAQGKHLVAAALILARRAGDAVVLARALRADGHRYALHAEYRRALGQYTRAAAMFAEHRDALQLAITYSGGLQTEIYLGLYDRALDHAARARTIFRRLDDRVRLARLESNVGNIHFRQDQFEKALACYRRAEREMRALGEHQDVAIALRNSSVCLTSLNRFAESLETYEEARRYCETHGLRMLVAEADYNIAYLHFLCGDYDRALRAYGQARREADELGDRYHRTLCDLDEAEVCLELNDDSGAARLAADAVRGFIALGMRYERAKATAFLATAQARLGDLSAALAAFGRARTLFAADGNAAWVAIVDLSRATSLFKAGRVADAARLVRRPPRALPPTARVVHRLLAAQLALQRRQPAVARRATRGALEGLRQVHAPSLEWQVHLVTGEALEASGETAAAVTAYRRARRALDALRTHVAGDDYKVSFLANKLAVYEHLVRLAMAHETAGPSRDAAIFALVEDAKSRSLADLLAFKAAELEGQPTAAVPVRDVRSLRHEMRAFERRIAREALQSAPDATRLRRLRSAVAVRERRLSTALAALRAQDEPLADLQTGMASSLATVQAVLPAGTTLLEYYVAGGTLYALIITAADVHVATLGPIAEAERILQLLRFQLAKFQLGPDYVRTFRGVLAAAANRHLQELHDRLIAPLRDHLQGRHLVIVPHGALHYLPFQALYDGRQYLMDQFAISYAPNATVYRLCQQTRPSAATGSAVLALADAYAPHIRREAEEVASVLPAARLYLGEEASASRLREAGADARFLHVATHGFFRRDNPMLSAVRLSGGDLTLADLYSLRVDADLVTLSGCGTGLSAVVGGDELVGLVRGLLYAGARSVLLTLWQVDDYSTAEFMGRFYQRLVAGASRADALNDAMRLVRDRFPHPYYWAPFVLIGQSSDPYISGDAAVPRDPKGFVGGPRRST